MTINALILEGPHAGKRRPFTYRLHGETMHLAVHKPLSVFDITTPSGGIALTSEAFETAEYRLFRMRSDSGDRFYWLLGDRWKSVDGPQISDVMALLERGFMPLPSDHEEAAEILIEKASARLAKVRSFNRGGRVQRLLDEAQGVAFCAGDQWSKEEVQQLSWRTGGIIDGVDLHSYLFRDVKPREQQSDWRPSLGQDIASGPDRAAFSIATRDAAVTGRGYVHTALQEDGEVSEERLDPSDAIARAFK